MARIRANLRKSGSAEDSASELIRVGNALVIDPQNLTVKKNGEEVSLTRNEFMILSKMAARPARRGAATTSSPTRSATNTTASSAR